jgi:hypothetical protein
MLLMGVVRNVTCGRVLAAAVSSATPTGSRAGGRVLPCPVPHSAVVNWAVRR